MGICWVSPPASQFQSKLTIILAQVVLLLSGLIVSSRLSRSPWLWRGVGVFIVVGWITINTVLLTQSRILRPASEIFTNYRNETGWSSRPYVYLIGSSSSLILLPTRADLELRLGPHMCCIRYGGVCTHRGGYEGSG